MSDFKTTIGLEIHCQLKTKSKMFCSCNNNAENAEPNTLVCPVCLAMPGTLPVTNRQAIEWTVMTGLALGCEIPAESKFDRKHYFYPDLPKGFQISQYDKPLCVGGNVEIRMTNDEIHTIRLNRIHLEEDAGKLIHHKAGSPMGPLLVFTYAEDFTLVDLNRAGTPLMEIVTEPDITSPQEARKFMEELQLALRYLKVSDADMEKGHLRCDANISVQKDGKSSPIVEIKNLNSFKFVEQALQFEEKRLSDDFENWPEKRVKITRGFDSNKGITFEQRRKEEAADYRYFPEPDIPPISLSKEKIKDLRSKILELPKAIKQKYIDLGVRPDVADKLIRQPHLVDYLRTSEENIKEASNFVVEEATRLIKENNISFEQYREKVPVTNISELMRFVGTGIISNTMAKEIFAEMLRTGKKAAEIIKEKGLGQISDISELDAVVNGVIKENPDLLEKYRAGKTQVIGFFVGEIMRRTGGKANPQVINKLLKEKLDEHVV